MNPLGFINLGTNTFQNPLFLIINTLAGWTLLYAIAHWLEKFRYSEFLAFLGVHTIYIIFIHFIGFKVITILQCIIYDYPAYMIAYFPIIDGSNGWWILYTIAGIGIPLLYFVFHTNLRSLWNKFKILYLTFQNTLLSK